MLPIANKPVLQYVIEHIKKAGIHDVCLVVGDESDSIMKHFGTGSDFELSITYIFQKQRLGIAQAVSLCEGWIGDEPFVLILGDNIFKTPLKEILLYHQKSENEVTVCLTEVPNPSEFGVAVVEGGIIKKLLEKPKNPPSNLIIVGIYIFQDPKRVFEVIRELKPSARGEYEITDALQRLIDTKACVGNFNLRGWKDTGKPEDLLEANRLVLEDLAPQNKGRVDAHVSGALSVGEGSVITGRIVGPVIVGKNCTIEDGVLGPFVSIGDNTTVRSSEMKDCIIMNDTVIDAPWILNGSIIGKNCTISSDIHLGPVKLTLGDHSKIET
jgi:glucose-1-phosphate thymidylyltransferase